MKPSPKHSFCVLAYERSPYLRECIESLLKQDVKSDIILCTSTPSDQLRCLAEEFGIGYATNRTRQGMAADWNFALRSARTQFVTLAHQDDLYLPEYASSIVRLLEQSKDSIIGFTDYGEIRINEINLTSPILAIKRLLRWPLLLKPVIRSTFFKRALLLFGSTIPCPAVTFNMQNCSAFEFSDSFRVNLDWYAWLQLAQTTGAFVYSRDRLLLHRIHENSETSIGIRDNTRLNEDVTMFTMIWGRAVGSILARIYRLSYLNNSINRRRW